jgi:hypothetical protein
MTEDSRCVCMEVTMARLRQETAERCVDMITFTASVDNPAQSVDVQEMLTMTSVIVATIATNLCQTRTDELAMINRIITVARKALLEHSETPIGPVEGSA